MLPELFLCCFACILLVIEIYTKQSSSKKLLKLLQVGCTFTALGFTIACFI